MTLAAILRAFARALPRPPAGRLLAAALSAGALVGTAPAHAAPRAVFYLMETQKSVNSFTAHADKIDLLGHSW